MWHRKVKRAVCKEKWENTLMGEGKKKGILDCFLLYLVPGIQSNLLYCCILHPIIYYLVYILNWFDNNLLPPIHDKLLSVLLDNFFIKFAKYFFDYLLCIFFRIIIIIFYFVISLFYIKVAYYTSMVLFTKLLIYIYIRSLWVDL